MTAINSTTSTLLVAIDISKHRQEVLIGIPGKTRRRRMTITNTLDDFQRLATALASYDLPVRIGFEATGNYHRPLAHHLGQAGFELKLISSVGLARTREALHNSWDKNDPKDAQVILHMLEIGAVQFFHDPLGMGIADIQELSKTHDIVSRFTGRSSLRYAIVGQQTEIGQRAHPNAGSLPDPSPYRRNRPLIFMSQRPQEKAANKAAREATISGLLVTCDS